MQLTLWLCFCRRSTERLCVLLLATAFLLLCFVGLATCLGLGLAVRPSMGCMLIVIVEH